MIKVWQISAGVSLALSTKVEETWACDQLGQASLQVDRARCSLTLDNAITILGAKVTIHCTSTVFLK